jgi:propanediol dehydratase small subunit
MPPCSTSSSVRLPAGQPSPGNSASRAAYPLGTTPAVAPAS